MIGAVDTAKAIRAVLQAELDGGSIAGRLQLEDGPPLPFSGWLGLVAAIDAAARPSPGRPSGSTHPPVDLLEGRLEPPQDGHGPRRVRHRQPPPSTS